MIDPKEYNQSLRKLASAHGFEITVLAIANGHEILAIRRSANVYGTKKPPKVYLSSGVHGDEPAGPLAILQLIERGLLPTDISLTLCPLINPVGIERGTRETKDGVDLNRDFRHPTAPETLAVTRFLNPLPPFDLSICLHEDWESTGFYLYAIDFVEAVSRSILEAAETFGPLDRSPNIDGHPAEDGLILVPANLTIEERMDWPEAFYLYSKGPHPHLTTESPSTFPLAERVEMQIAAITKAFEIVQSVHKTTE